jgi:transcriptional regulator with XRE-family HTH domain
MSLRELARRVGISASALSQIEVGRSGPSVNTLYEIARQLDATPNEIFFGNSSPGTMQVNIHSPFVQPNGQESLAEGTAILQDGLDAHLDGILEFVPRAAQAGSSSWNRYSTTPPGTSSWPRSTGPMAPGGSS